jgi:glycosyltransferase involved in cell wall biosynthesis
MNTHEQPFVSVLTPVYNGEEFLAECIESVLAQTYSNWEYIIVNNCSADRSLEIALDYAKKDNRIRIQNNHEFVGVIENHNLAFSLISPRAKYCKVVSADDFIFPECITKMVEFAEANPCADIVGSYQLSGCYLKWQGFQYPTAVFPGFEICRHFFLLSQLFVGGEPIYGFGTPTSILYRADLIRGSGGQFYPNSSPHADTSACFKYLQKSSFGFIYQVLSYERTHEATQSTKSKELNRFWSAFLNDLQQYGPYYLTKEELEREVDKQLNGYHQFLATNYFIGFRGTEFWSYHENKLKELGYPLTRLALVKAGLITILKGFLNPEQAIRKLWKHMFPRSTNLAPRAAQPRLGEVEISRRKSKDSETIGLAHKPPR